MQGTIAVQTPTSPAELGTTVFAVQIVALFLLLVVILSARYLMRNRDQISAPDPNRFSTLFCVWVGMLLLWVMFAAFLGLENMLLSLGLAGGLALSVLDPVVAVSFLIANLWLRPWELASDSVFLQGMPKMLAAVAVLSWIFHSVRRKEFHFTWNFQCKVFVSLLIWFVLSAIFSDDVVAGVDYFSDRFIPIAVLTLLLLSCVRDQKGVTLISSTIVTCTVGVVAVALYLTFSKTAISPGVLRMEGYGLMGNANDLASLIVMVIPFYLAQRAERRGFFKRYVVSGSVLGLLMTGLWLSKSRGALLAIGMMVVAHFLFCRKGRKPWLLLLLTLLIVPAVILSGVGRSESDITESSMSRWEFVVAGLRMAKDNPVFGVGIGNYPKNYERYTPGFTVWGLQTAHSSWLLVLAETGAMGLLLFASLFWSTFKRAWRIRMQQPQFFLSMVGYGVVMSFLSHSYLLTPYLLVALVLAASNTFESEAETDSVLGRTETSGRLREVAAMLLLFLFVASPRIANAADQIVFEAAPGGDKPVAAVEPRTAKTLALRGSRGEVLNFLLKISMPECRHFATTGFAISPDSAGVTFPVRLYRMPYIHTKKASFPGAHVGSHYDPLIPVQSSKLCSVGESKTWYWGELEIPRHATPGRYRAAFSLGSDAHLPVRLDVWRMTIPERATLPAYMPITAWYNLLGHYGKWRDGEGALAKQYIAAMQEHRIYPLDSLVATPEVMNAGGRPSLNIRSFPNSQESFYELILKARPDWAYFDFPAFRPPKVSPGKSDVYLRAVESTIQQLRKEGNAIFYLWDEPTKEDRPQLIQLAKHVRKFAPSLKIMVTTPYHPSLEGLVDIFVPEMGEYGTRKFPGSKTYRKLARNDVRTWWYVSCMSHGCEKLDDQGTPDFVIERPAAYIRSIAWLAHGQPIEAFLYYLVNYAYQFYPKRDPWKNQWDFSGNGDGTLFYPGRPGLHGLSRHTPIPSVRLKLWRETSYDAEYLRWFSELPHQPEWWNQEYRKLIKSPRQWNRNYSAYRALRNRLGEYLNQHGVEERRIASR